MTIRPTVPGKILSGPPALVAATLMNLTFRKVKKITGKVPTNLRKLPGNTENLLKTPFEEVRALEGPLRRAVTTQTFMTTKKTTVIIPTFERTALEPLKNPIMPKPTNAKVVRIMIRTSYEGMSGSYNPMQAVTVTSLVTVVSANLS